MSWFGMAFMTSGQETDQALFLQLRSSHGAYQKINSKFIMHSTKYTQQEYTH